MSYNISSVEAKVLDAWMLAEDVVTLFDDNEFLAEANFLAEMVPQARRAIAEGKPDEHIKLPEYFWWYGEGSGSTFEDVLIPKIAPKIMGRVEAVLVWEGGDSIDGILIHDGRVEQCEVEITLVKPEGWE